MKTLIGAFLALFVASSASAVTLTFGSATGCNGGNVCNNGTALDQSYGDITGVDVIYDGNTNTVALEDVLHWNGGYGNFGSAIYAPTSTNPMSITLDAAPGYEVTLSELLIGPWSNFQTATSVVIIDLATNIEVSDTSYTSLTTGAAATISGTGWTSAEGFVIIFGPDAYYNGIGSITYSAMPAAVVPLPAAGWLLLSVVGGLFVMRRRIA